MADTTHGIVLTTAEIASEGLATVLDTIAATGANAVTVTPGVLLPGTPDAGVREPPLDVMGQARLLDRPLWGQRELYLRGFSPYLPDADLWSTLPYPAPKLAPPEARTDLTAQVLAGAPERGLQAYLQISPYTVPGAPGGQSVQSGHTQSSAENRPVRLDQQPADRVVAGHGCLNNPHVRALGRVRVLEAARHYGTSSGIFLDWVEYTCYFLEDCFTCFCPHCQAAATAAGYDWAAIVRDSTRLWDRLHHLTAADLQRATSQGDWPLAMAGPRSDYPGFAALLEFKAATVLAALRDLRAALDHEGHAIPLELNGFAPPWSLLTGLDYGQVGQVATAVRCKLFTFHWPMITRWWAESLLAWNRTLDEQAVLQAVLACLDLPAPPDEHRQRLRDYGMPHPTEPHPITMAALTRKLDQAVTLAGGTIPCQAYLHSYRPVDEFAAVLAAAEASMAQGCWVQRYGYLSDEKLAILRRHWRG